VSWRPLKRICADTGQYGFNVPAGDYVGEGEGVRLIRTSDLAGGRLQPDSDGIFVPGPVPKQFILEPSDILLSRSGTIGRSFLVPREAAGRTFAGFLVRFRPRADQDARYIAYALQSEHAQAQVQADAIVSTIQNFNAERYANLSLWIPPLEEQRRIADFLDDQVTLLDRAITLRQQQADLALESFRSCLADAVLLPEGSGMRTRLINMFEYERNGIWGSESDGGPDDIKCVRVADFDRLAFRADVAQTIRNVPLAQRRPRLMRRGDVLLEKSGGTNDKPVGCAVIYESDEPAICSNFVAILRPSTHVLPEFAGFVMAACYQSRLNGPFVNQTTGIQNLDSAAYLRLSINLPTPDVQRANVDQVLAGRDRCESLIALYERQSKLLGERKQSLITAAVTGQFDVTTARRVA
jgi:type I restriction enzyme, S subunit